MKSKVILGLLAVGLMANGSSCLNDPFIVPLNAPLTHCEVSNPGQSWGDDPPTTVYILGEIPEDYQDLVVGARLVDVVVYATNAAPTDSVNGEAGILTQSGYQQVVTFRGNGRDFSERRSLLKDQSPLIASNPAGVDSLESLINRFIANPENTFVTIDSRGIVLPTSTGHEVCVEILVQVDAEVPFE
jgi:hypothetical protein